MIRILSVSVMIAALCLLTSGPGIVRADSIGEHMQQMEQSLQQKEVELGRLQQMHKELENQIGTVKAQMAQSVTNTVPKIGYQKTNAQGFVTATGGVVHGPSQHWKLNLPQLRKEYENAGIYTRDEIEAILTFHEAYVNNQGFTAEATEYIATMAELTAQKRTIEGYIDRKQQEIKELENALTGSSPGADSSADGGGDGGGGDGGGDGY